MTPLTLSCLSMTLLEGETQSLQPLPDPHPVITSYLVPAPLTFESTKSLKTSIKLDFEVLYNFGNQMLLLFESTSCGALIGWSWWVKMEDILGGCREKRWKHYLLGVFIYSFSPQTLFTCIYLFNLYSNHRKILILLNI